MAHADIPHPTPDARASVIHAEFAAFVEDGGCRLLRNTRRNFYRPERRDVFAGFRTCTP